MSDNPEQVTPGSTTTVYLASAPPGLVGTLTFRLVAADDTVVIAESTAGITESTQIEGRYAREVTWPTERGIYTAVWRNGVFQPTEDFEVGYSSDYRPTVEDVAALMRARTRVDMNEQGTFNDDTRPTGDQVALLIDEAMDEVAGHLGEGPMTDAVKRRTQRAVTLYTAMLVEVAYWPEQLNDDQSPFAAYRDLYDKAIEGLAASVTTDAGDVQGIGMIAVASTVRPPDGTDLLPDPFA